MSPAVPPAEPRESRLAVGLFLALLIFHSWAISVGWTSLNLPGSEFRQAQTAVSALFIQQEHNYSLAYPTPVLGKPWPVPMEFPLYQWTVAALSNATGWPLTQTGRAVNLACFYLTFPALFLLLGRLGVPRSRRWVALGFLLTCPLYVIYGRAFLMETMALMFSVWFLLAYVHAVERRSWRWLVFATLCGLGAGLVKVTTFLLILMPAFLWTLAWLWRARPGTPGGGMRELARVAAWALAAVALPCAASVWWIRYADAVKALNPVGAFLVSDNLTSYNFGFGAHFSPAIWAQHWGIWRTELGSPAVLAGVAALALLFLRRGAALAGGLLFFFLAVQMLFPVLYAFHPYYYVANGFLLMLAVGLVLGGVLDSRLPRAAAWSLVLAVQAAQILGCVQQHYAEMKDWSHGGSPLTEALKGMTDPADLLVIAGDDWNSMKPYYAQRRALMLPNGRESEPAFVARAFRNLQGERIAALVLCQAQRENRVLIDAAVQAFGLHPKPVFTWQDVTVYLREDTRLTAIPRLPKLRDGEYVHLTADAVADENALLRREVELASLPPSEQKLFAQMSPRPWKFQMNVRAELVPEGDRQLLLVHPDATLWFKVPPGRHTVTVECFIAPGAYADSLTDGDATDGVEYTIGLARPDGTVVPLATRLLDPRHTPADRGYQRLEYDGEIPAGAEVVVLTGPGPHGSYSRDWALVGRIEIK